MLVKMEGACSELDKLIHNCEFENQQYVRLIQHENSLIERYEKECAESRAEQDSLKTSIEQHERDIEQCKRQDSHNRGNNESLKSTSHVLTEHLAAMTTKLNMVKTKRQQKKLENELYLQKYRNIWAQYKEKYETFPYAPEYKLLCQNYDELVQKIKEKKDIIYQIKQRTAATKGQQDVNMLDIRAFIIKIAENRVEKMRTEQQIKERQLELRSRRNNHMNSLSTSGGEVTSQQLSAVPVTDIQDQEAMESCDQLTYKQPDITSPMISVFSEKEDIDGMQMEEDMQLVDGHAVETEEAIVPDWVQQYQQTSKPKQGQSLQLPPACPVQHTIPDEYSTMNEESIRSSVQHMHIDDEPQDNKLHTSFVSYQKANETVEIHLTNAASDISPVKSLSSDVAMETIVTQVTQPSNLPAKIFLSHAHHTPINYQANRDTTVAPRIHNTNAMRPMSVPRQSSVSMASNKQSTYPITSHLAQAPGIRVSTQFKPNLPRVQPNQQNQQRIAQPPNFSTTRQHQPYTSISRPQMFRTIPQLQSPCFSRPQTPPRFVQPHLPRPSIVPYKQIRSPSIPMTRPPIPRLNFDPQHAGYRAQKPSTSQIKLPTSFCVSAPSATSPQEGMATQTNSQPPVSVQQSPRWSPLKLPGSEPLQSPQKLPGSESPQSTQKLPGSEPPQSTQKLPGSESPQSTQKLPGSEPPQLHNRQPHKKLEIPQLKTIQVTSRPLSSIQTTSHPQQTVVQSRQLQSPRVSSHAQQPTRVSSLAQQPPRVSSLAQQPPRVSSLAQQPPRVSTHGQQQPEYVATPAVNKEQDEQEAAMTSDHTLTEQNISSNMEAGDIYYIPLKEPDMSYCDARKQQESPECTRRADSPAISPKTPDCQRTDSDEISLSPFDIVKHKKKLEELKQSPRQMSLDPGRRMFSIQAEGSPSDSDKLMAPPFGQVSNDSPGIMTFGGAGDFNNTPQGQAQASGMFGDHQSTTECGDNGRVSDQEAESAFNFFAAFGSKPGMSEIKEHSTPGVFSLFGAISSQEDRGADNFFQMFAGSDAENAGKSNKTESSGFSFNFGGDTGSSDVAASDSDRSTGFSFNFGNDNGTSSPPRRFSLF